MSTETLEQTMARPKGRPRKSERDDITVRIDRTIVAKAKLVATWLGLEGGVAELLSDLVRGPVDRAYGKMLREIGPEGPSPPKRKE